MEVKENKNSNKNIVMGFMVVFASLFVLGMIIRDKDAKLNAKPKEEIVEEKPDALIMMESVFVGEHSKEAIKGRLGKLLRTYKMEVSEDNYNKVGSVLITLSKESKSNISEMELADCMIHAYTDQAPIKLTEAAGLCAVLMDVKNSK